MKILYEARIIDLDSNKIITKISSSSLEGLEEEQGKSKWTEAIKRYKEENGVSACCGARMDEYGRCMKCKEMSGPDDIDCQHENVGHDGICDDCGEYVNENTGVGAGGVEER